MRANPGFILQGKVPDCGLAGLSPGGFQVAIVDIGMARVADTPENFDVVVTLNLYGDIVSDIASQISGSVGLAGSMNIGRKYAMFEAIHGSAPDIAGKGIANPSGLLNGAMLMLHHIGQSDAAIKIENAWLKSLEDGHCTGDICPTGRNPLGTTQFANTIIENLGQMPATLPVATVDGYGKIKVPTLDQCTVSERKKELVGADVYVDWRNTDSQEVGRAIEAAGHDGLKFVGMSLRGVRVYPPLPDTETEVTTDWWRCRFRMENPVTNGDIRKVLSNMEDAGIDWVKVENLYTYDGEQGFSQIQGEHQPITQNKSSFMTEGAFVFYCGVD